MMLSRSSVLAIASWATLGLGLEAPIKGYGVQQIQWEAQAFPGGPMLNLTGTVQEVRARLLEINPNFDRDFPASVGGEHEKRTAADVDARSESIEKRYGPVCGPHGTDWKNANYPGINSEISYLRGVPGTPTAGPGPGNCARVSCSWYDAVWWCNDNDHTFSLPSFNTIADCAQVIVDECYPSFDGTTSAGVCGQNFNGDNWNCIVRHDSC
ncbi:hypothetical protein VTI28DRAFT_6465 [Corynascus sepedonium]